MRKLWLFPLVVAALAAAGPIQLDQATTKTFTDCSASGSAAQTITQGTYLMTVTTEDVWLCLADSSSTCSSGGTKFPAPFAMQFSVGSGGISASCRSGSATGDIQFTKAN